MRHPFDCPKTEPTMSAFDFTLPAPIPNYNALAARQAFESAGSERAVAAGKTVFREGDKASALLLQSDKMYFLAEGEVELTVAGETIGRVRPGEVFGEMAVITGMPRTATATATMPSSFITLDKFQLQTALGNDPEFGLLLMNIMIAHMRDAMGVISARGIELNERGPKDYALLDKKTLGRLVDEFDASACIRYPAEKVIVQEGQAGVLVYVVVEGSVEISIQGNTLGTIGQGGLFGEMALISRAERTATATALTNCTLLAINRSQFLELVRSNPKFAVALLGAVGNRARFIASMRN